MLPDLRFISWEQNQTLIEQLASKIKNDEFTPDIIIAISRGGFIPARILCDQLKNQRLTCIQIEYYKGMNDANQEPSLIFPLNANVNGLNVLIVDDISDSGTSLVMAVKHALSEGAEYVKTAAVHIKPWTRFIPDYYSQSVDEWIIYPWEINESLNEITLKLVDQGIESNLIKNELIRLGFTEKQIKDFSPQK